MKSPPANKALRALPGWVVRGFLLPLMTGEFFSESICGRYSIYSIKGSWEKRVTRNQ
jgi:hypothetical protein